jgi:hypothetical protein
MRTWSAQNLPAIYNARPWGHERERRKSAWGGWITYLVWATRTLFRNCPVSAKKKEHQLSPFPPSNRRALSQPPGEKGRGCSRCKQWGKDREAGRIWGCGRPTDLLTTQTPRRKQAAQSKAAHRVGTRGGLCGLAAAIIALRPPRMPRLVRMGRGGKGKGWGERSPACCCCKTAMLAAGQRGPRCCLDSVHNIYPLFEQTFRFRNLQRLA